MFILLRQMLLTISRIPPVLLLTGIIGLGLLACYAVNNKIAQIEGVNVAFRKDILDKANQKGRVVYATKDIAEGESLATDSLEEREIPVGKVPPDALASSSLAIGKVAKYGISQGAVVSQHDLSIVSQSGFEAQLKEGARAVTFAVDNNSGVAGFVCPDSRVDIFAMVGTGIDTRVSPVLSDVQVVAVGQTFKKQSESVAIPSSSITVSVNPDEAQKLMKAISASKLYVALRNRRDHSPIATVDVTSLYKKPTNAASLLENTPPPPLLLPTIGQSGELKEIAQQREEIKAPPLRYQVETWSGSRRDVLNFGGG